MPKRKSPVRSKRQPSKRKSPVRSKRQPSKRKSPVRSFNNSNVVKKGRPFVIQCVKEYTDAAMKRPSPMFIADKCCHLTKKGNDGNLWFSERNSKGGCTWKRKNTL